MKRDFDFIPLKGINELGETYSAIQMLPSMQERYPDQLKPEIVSIRMYQTASACFLEVTEKTHELTGDDFADADPVRPESRIDYRTERTDLGFIRGGEFLCFFDPVMPVQYNAKLLLRDFDDNSMLNCTNIIKESAIENILENPDQHLGDADEQNDLTDPVIRQLEDHFTSEDLAHMDGYRSNLDFNGVATPQFTWRVESGFCIFTFYQDPEHDREDVFRSMAWYPDFVRFSFQAAELSREWEMKIATEEILSIDLKAEESYFGPAVPDKYSCLIRLSKGGTLVLSAGFTDNLPEYAYHQARVDFPAG